jgi:hypothetical protein
MFQLGTEVAHSHSHSPNSKATQLYHLREQQRTSFMVWPSPAGFVMVQRC